MRERCYECYRPVNACFCDAIPQIDNRTDVLILQHMRERFHPFNTARIVKKALRRCEIMSDYHTRFGEMNIPIGPSAGLLYPDDQAPTLAELPESQRPKQLIIVDGTWHHAKTILRDAPQLREIPFFRLSPTTPGRYRIRREPDDRSLSTVEATVAALQSLEPETVGLDHLLAAFERMVNDQVNHRGSRAVRRRKARRSANIQDIPRALLDPHQGLVVAYGESTPSSTGRSRSNALPVNWIAKRLDSGECFSQVISQPTPLEQANLGHFRLTEACFEKAVSPATFRESWNRFLRPTDTLIVYHPRTFHLLQRIEASQPPCLFLKAVFGKRQSRFSSLEELLALEKVALPSASGQSRAEFRLNMAVALVEHLQQENLGSD